MIVTRPAAADLYVEGPRCAVFVDGQVVVLSELATSILLAVPEHGEAPLTLITERIMDEYGVPEAPLVASDVVRAQVDALAQHGVLQLPETDHAAQPDRPQ